MPFRLRCAPQQPAYGRAKRFVVTAGSRSIHVPPLSSPRPTSLTPPNPFHHTTSALSPQPLILQFIFNVYYDDQLGKQLCTCSRSCQDSRYVPGAQAFAVCLAGSNSNAPVQSKAKANHHKRDVAVGKRIRYMAKVKNINYKQAVEGLAVAMRLPAAGVVYWRSKTSKAYALIPSHIGGKGSNKTVYHTTKRLAAGVNTTSTPPTVTWYDVTLPPRKDMRFLLEVRVRTTGVLLVFGGGVYQQLPVDGQPYCFSAFANQTVLAK